MDILNSTHLLDSRLSFVKKMEKTKTKPDDFSNTSQDVALTVEAVFGCKWSLRILKLISEGTTRPGEIERRLVGLTPKVKNHYFKRMMELGVLKRIAYPEAPPKVEYHLTEFGREFMPLLDAIKELQYKLEKKSQ